MPMQDKLACLEEVDRGSCSADYSGHLLDGAPGDQASVEELNIRCWRAITAGRLHLGRYCPASALCMLASLCRLLWCLHASRWFRILPAFVANCVAPLRMASWKRKTAVRVTLVGENPHAIHGDWKTYLPSACVSHAHYDHRFSATQYTKTGFVVGSLRRYVWNRRRHCVGCHRHRAKTPCSCWGDLLPKTTDTRLFRPRLQKLYTGV